MMISDTLGTAIAIVGMLALMGLLLWAAKSGNSDREAEAAAREFYSRHGHWPDEAPPGPPSA